MKKSNLIKRILAYTLVFSVVFSQMIFSHSILRISAEETGVWDGTKAESFAGGSGTAADPYLIENGAQLYKMVADYSGVSGSDSELATPTHFRIINDIYLNNITDADMENPTTDSLKAKGFKPWYTHYSQSVGFCGVIDGGGHTVYGLYANAGTYSGLIPNAVDIVGISNLNLKNSYVYATGAAGGIVGGAFGSVTTVTVKGCTVDNILVDGGSGVRIAGIIGGLAGSVKNAAISNCAVTRATLKTSHKSYPNIQSALLGYTGEQIKGHTVTDCYTDGSAYPVTDTTNAVHFKKFTDYITYTNVYTAASNTNSVAGVTQLTEDQMKGENAKTYMPGLDFFRIWQTTDNSYPEFVKFDSGDGTRGNPFTVSTAGQLCKMVADYSNTPVGSKPAAHTYFKITQDIDLEGKQWCWFGQGCGSNTYISAITTGFSGIIDGDGHTISNLSNGTDTNYAQIGLIPIGTQGAEVHNLTVKSAVLTGNNVGGVLFSLIKATGGSSAPIVIDKCSVEDSSISMNDTAGGLVGYIYGQSLKISNSRVVNTTAAATGSGKSSRAAAFFGSANASDNVYNNTLTVSESFCTLIKPIGPRNNDWTNASTFTNVYTSYEGSVEGITKLTDAQMTGENAKENMVGFNFDSIWATVENSYPIHANTWDGTKAESFAGGSGTADDPFIITNGSELYKMVADYSNTPVTQRPHAHTYFKITKDINLGNKQWYATKKSNWFSNEVYNTIGFSGIIFGEGHTITGLSDSSVTGTSSVGLIPIASQGAEIHDLHLENGVLVSNSGSKYAAGAFVGLAKGASGSAPVVIDGCSVRNFSIAAVNGAGAFVGYTYSQSISIRNSYCVDTQIVATASSSANAGAFIGVAGGNDYANIINVENSYATEVNPTILENDAFKAITTFANVYTSNEAYDGSVEGITKLNSEAMIGEAAKANMPGFNFNQIWKTADNKYPVHFAYGLYWNGDSAAKYAEGSGTETDPYQISNSSELFLLANSGRESTYGKYFKLTQDIVISRVYDNWQNDNPISWAKKTAYLDGFKYSNSFAGVLDGAGHTVSGLYFNDEIADGGAYAYGLIPLVSADAIIKNITVQNVSSSVTGTAYVGDVAGAVHVTENDAQNQLKWVQFIGVSADKIYAYAARGVKTDAHTGENVYAYNSFNANAHALVNIKRYLLGTDLYITDINADGTFDICDLITAKKCLAMKEEDEELVWSQEFDGTAPDYSVLNKNTSMSRGTTIEYADNAAVSDGKLKLSCTDTGKTDANGDKIYSVNYGLDTMNTMSFKYGRVEMRAKIPFGPGAFPSLWLTSRGALGYQKNSAYSNEIDVFEVFGSGNSATQAAACIHKWLNDENGVKTGEEISSGTRGEDIYCSDNLRSAFIRGAAQNEWHTFVFEWTEDQMSFSCDGTNYYTLKREKLNEESYDLFNQFLGIRINNHMFSKGDGAPYKFTGSAEIDPTKLDYEIDYIRLYQKNDGKSKIIFK